MDKTIVEAEKEMENKADAQLITHLEITAKRNQVAFKLLERLEKQATIEPIDTFAISALSSAIQVLIR